MTAVVWLPNSAATRLHAVHADATVPRGELKIATVCRPASLTALLPPGKVLGTELPKCKACLNRLVEDPPPRGGDDRWLNAAT